LSPGFSIGLENNSHIQLIEDGNKKKTERKQKETKKQAFLFP